MSGARWRVSAHRGMAARLLTLALLVLPVLILAGPAGAGDDSIDPVAAPVSAPVSGSVSGSVGQPVLDPARSLLLAEGRDRGRARPLDLRLAVGARAPYRAYLLGEPPRLVIEMQGLTLPPLPAPEPPPQAAPPVKGGEAAPSPGAEPAPLLPGAALLAGLRWGPGPSGWSRIVAELPAPYRLASVGYDGADMLAIRLEPVAKDAFTPRPDSLTALRGLPQPVPLPPPAERGALRVALDPGHGGIDPGAEAGGLTEAALMLDFAKQVQAALAARGIEAVLTRTEDRFVPLEQRTTLARNAGAGLFLSLHADLLPQGEAAGATIYIWNPASNDRGARELALRHDKADLLGGAELSDSGEAVTRALIDLAQTDNQPRSLRFAKHLSSELNLAGVGLAGRPVRGAGFSVLKSPDIPSVLLEVGFLSDPTDRARLADPAWRDRAAAAIARAVADWTLDDAAAAPRRLR